MRRSENIVYCALNSITNKSYIGWCTNFKERKSRHIREAELGSKTRFYNAIRKYGADSFEWSIIFNDLKSHEDCKQMEIRMIALFDTYNNGYNSTKGGDGGFTGHNSGQFKKGQKPWNTGITYDEVYCEKLRVAQTGKKQTVEQIEKRAAKLRGRPMPINVRLAIRKALVGHTVSNETREKIGIKVRKPVIQYDLAGNELKRYKSAKEAQKLTRIYNIPSACRGVYTQVGGFKWKYLNI